MRHPPPSWDELWAAAKEEPWVALGTLWAVAFLVYTLCVDLYFSS